MREAASRPKAAAFVCVALAGALTACGGGSDGTAPAGSVGGSGPVASVAPGDTATPSAGTTPDSATRPTATTSATTSAATSTTIATTTTAAADAPGWTLRTPIAGNPLAGAGAEAVRALVDTGTALVGTGQVMSDADSGDVFTVSSADGGTTWTRGATLAEPGQQIVYDSVVFDGKLLLGGYEIRPQDLLADSKPRHAVMWTANLDGSGLARLPTGTALDGVWTSITGFAVVDGGVIAVGSDETTGTGASSSEGFMVVWRSADGSTWTREQPAFPGLEEVNPYYMTVDGSTVYVGGQSYVGSGANSFDAFLASSADGGRTWQQLDPAHLGIPVDQGVHALAAVHGVLAAAVWDERVEGGETDALDLVWHESGVAAVTLTDQADVYLGALTAMGDRIVAAVRIDEGTVGFADVGPSGLTPVAGMDLHADGKLAVFTFARTPTRQLAVGRWTDAAGNVEPLIWSMPVG